MNTVLQTTALNTPSRATALEMSQQEDSLFFCLPAELRNKIYTELLCPEAVTAKCLAKRDIRTTTTPTPVYGAILSTCRRIHDEAGPLLYTQNIFHAHPSLLTSMPHYSSPDRPALYPNPLSLVKRWQISLRLDTDPRFTACQATQAFSGAEFLEIKVWQAQFHACDLAVLRLFLGVRGVKVVRVLGLEREDVARWLERVMMSGRERKEEKSDLQIEGEVLGWGLDSWRFGER
ncbi:hypothetical protein P280DRAFT_409637 [Massarina eburnea CBS 473.64]|uniref:F-box domain-containing protein n=1 Tax=Massarina eburnea CBS 473.64 TaxID=1395130 RepID=A0A6A6RP40_9PLEO|nr:hypothetical protein P280DRAFT_409637 [Massarina eburnea CBS 473.64]